MIGAATLLTRLLKDKGCKKFSPIRWNTGLGPTIAPRLAAEAIQQ